MRFALAAVALWFTPSVVERRHRNFMAACAAINLDPAHCEFEWQKARASDCGSIDVPIIVPAKP
jgi:hypothetical protein